MSLVVCPLCIQTRTAQFKHLEDMQMASICCFFLFPARWDYRMAVVKDGHVPTFWPLLHAFKG